MEQQMKRIAGRRFLLPDGSERYLVERSASYQAHKGAGWTAHRSVEDECGPESALHDHVGRAEKRLSNGSIVLARSIKSIFNIAVELDCVAQALLQRLPQKDISHRQE